MKHLFYVSPVTGVVTEFDVDDDEVNFGIGADCPYCRAPWVVVSIEHGGTPRFRCQPRNTPKAVTHEHDVPEKTFYVREPFELVRTNPSGDERTP